MNCLSFDVASTVDLTQLYVVPLPVIHPVWYGSAGKQFFKHLNIWVGCGIAEIGAKERIWDEEISSFLVLVCEDGHVHYPREECCC